MVDDSYPGAMCVEISGDHPNNSARLVRNETGEILNGSPSKTLAVLCPIVGPFNDLSDGEANVFVHDRNRSEDICCQAGLNNSGAIRLGNVDCSEDVDTRAQVLELTPPVFNFSFTSRYITCTIPPTDRGEASRIRLYRH